MLYFLNLSTTQDLHIWVNIIYIFKEIEFLSQTLLIPMSFYPDVKDLNDVLKYEFF